MINFSAAMIFISCFCLSLSVSVVSAQETVSMDSMLMRAKRPSLQLCPQCQDQPNTEVIGKSSAPRQLFNSKAEDRLDEALSAKLRAISADDSVISLVFSRGTTILYEKYKDGVGPETQVLSLSMAKPLISILVGSARCKGVIKSLDDKAEIYSPALAGTAYGAASLRSLLTMRSGADYGAGSMGETSSGETGRWAFGVGSQIETMKARSGYNKRLFGQDKEGDWYYKNMDVYALSLVIRDSHQEPVSKLTQRYLWDKIGAEHNATWVLDRNKDPIVASFFAAGAHDWIRLAVYIAESIKEVGADPCFSRYLRDATTSKQTVKDELGFTGYGYLFRLNYLNDQTKAIVWFRGAFGQMLAIHPDTGFTIFLQSNHIRNLIPVADIFSDWISKHGK